MNNEHQITFKYIFQQDYNPVYCNGAYGGISPSGEIVANFFLERGPIPRSVTNEISEDGNLGENIANDPENIAKMVVRYVSTGIVMNESGARAIYNWLGAQLKKIEDKEAQLQTQDHEGK